MKEFNTSQDELESRFGLKHTNLSLALASRNITHAWLSTISVSHINIYWSRLNVKAFFNLSPTISISSNSVRKNVGNQAEELEYFVVLDSTGIPTVR
jgi:hypothetical protein